MNVTSALQWRHSGRDSVSNHQPHDYLLNRLFRRRSKKPSKLRVIGLCAGNSPETGEFPALMASNAENVSIWWRHHVYSNVSFHPVIVIMLVSCLGSPGYEHDFFIIIISYFSSISLSCLTRCRKSPETQLYVQQKYLRADLWYLTCVTRGPFYWYCLLI